MSLKSACFQRKKLSYLLHTGLKLEPKTGPF